MFVSPPAQRPETQQETLQADAMATWLQCADCSVSEKHKDRDEKQALASTKRDLLLKPNHKIAEMVEHHTETIDLGVDLGFSWRMVVRCVQNVDAVPGDEQLEKEGYIVAPHMETNGVSRRSRVELTVATFTYLCEEVLSQAVQSMVEEKLSWILTGGILEMDWILFMGPAPITATPAGQRSTRLGRPRDQGAWTDAEMRELHSLVITRKVKWSRIGESAHTRFRGRSYPMIQNQWYKVQGEGLRGNPSICKTWGCNQKFVPLSGVEPQRQTLCFECWLKVRGAKEDDYDMVKDDDEEFGAESGDEPEEDPDGRLQDELEEAIEVESQDESDGEFHDPIDDG
jgi:hypothetical protein